jgi:hypothetical protein
MEVHHHPEVEKKGFKEYILEGLMIFIAVMMGFFAESLREHISDGAKEAKFIKGIVRNLHDDVKSLDALHKYNSIKIAGIDSMILLSEQDISKPANLRLFYVFMRRYLLTNSRFSANDETLSQLRNSGGYLFIEKGSAADSIAKYDQLNNRLYSQGQYYDDGFSAVVNDALEIADFKILVNNNQHKNAVFTATEFPPLSGDKQKLKVFFNKILEVRGLLDNYNSKVLKQEDYGTRLISYLKKLYRLKDE